MSKTKTDPIPKLVTKTNGYSLDVLGQNIDVMRALFPDVFTEGSDEQQPRWRVDLEALGELLGEYVEDKQERYSFNWYGKARAKRIAQTPSTGTLRPCPEDSVNWDTTKNIFIEGDNLEVLKLLQKSYHRKVKMIYMDPPYNTGNEFIYPDKFQDNLDTYLKYTGQVGEDGLKISANSETGGRYHTNWLNMMYPRLKLARNLLANDGVMLISIDDIEVANLRKLCDEIFGEENFLAQFVWKCRQFTDSRSKRQISTDHEYVLAYGKSEDVVFRGQPRDESKYKNPDNDPRGDWMSRSMLGLATADQRPNLHYQITDPKTGNTFSPPETTGWRYSRERMENMIEEGCVLFPSKVDGRPREKKFRKDLQSQFTSFPTVIDGVHTSHGTAAIRSLFDDTQVFDFPKPTELLQKFVEQTVGDNEICMDLFAGSCATAHAVLDQNKEDGFQRRFIMVQLPEPVDPKSQAAKKGMKTISHLGSERIKRVIQEFNQDVRDLLDAKSDEESGFRYFNLRASVFTVWSSHQAHEQHGLEQQLELQVDNILPDATTDDVLFELLLKVGLDLSSEIVTYEVSGTKLYSIASGSLIVCMDKSISREVVDEVVRLRPLQFICLDSSFSGDDTLKVNVAQTLQSATDDLSNSQPIVFKTV